MTYAQLFQAVAAHLQGDITFNIQVQTWHFSHRREETQWQIYVQWNKDKAEFYNGYTPEEALGRLKSDVHSSAQSLEETSAAVGNAEVS